MNMKQDFYHIISDNPYKNATIEDLNEKIVPLEKQVLQYMHDIRNGKPIEISQKELEEMATELGNMQGTLNGRLLRKKYNV